MKFKTKQSIVKVIDGFMKLALITILLPFTIALALGYWTSSIQRGEDITFIQAFKNVLTN